MNFISCAFNYDVFFFSTWSDVIDTTFVEKFISFRQSWEVWIVRFVLYNRSFWVRRIPKLSYPAGTKSNVSAFTPSNWDIFGDWLIFESELCSLYCFITNNLINISLSRLSLSGPLCNERFAPHAKEIRPLRIIILAWLWPDCGWFLLNSNVMQVVAASFIVSIFAKS